MTHQRPQLASRYRERRYLRPVVPQVERSAVTRERRAPNYCAWWYAFRQWVALCVANLDLLLGQGRVNESMRREQIRRGVERSRPQKLLRRWDRWILDVTGLSTRSGRERHTYLVENVAMSRFERARYVLLLAASASRLWRGRNRPSPRARLYPDPELTLAWCWCWWRAQMFKLRHRFPWTTFRVQGFLLWWLHPRIVWLRLTGPQILKPERMDGPVPSRWRWTPGIAYMPRAALTLVTAETTTTADPGTSGTTLALTSRTGLNQDATAREYLLIQNSETDKTNREYVYFDGAAGTGAGNVTVVRAQEGTAGVAHPIGSYVVPVLTPTQLKNIKQNATGLFSAKDQYAAKGDNGTDDATALQNTISAVPTISWRNGNIRAGIVLLDPGSYVCRTALTLPTSNIVNGVYESHVTIQGSGWKASQIRRQNSDTNILMDASGSITAGNVVTRQMGFQFRDAGLNGADATTPLLRYYYHQTSTVERAYFQSNNGPGIEGVEYQDSHLIGSWFDYIGGATDSTTAGTAAGKEALRILSRADSAVTGTFGYSTDNSNAIWIFGNHFTGLNSDVRGQYVVSDNGSGNQAHRCTLINNKIEQQQMGGDQVKLFNVHDIHFQNQEFTGYSLFTGRTAISWINGNAATSISIRASYFADEGNAGVTHAAIKVTACNYWTLEDIVFNFSTVGAEANPAVFADLTGGTNDNFFLSNYKITGTRTTPFYSGTAPVNFYTPLRSYVIVKTADTTLAGTGVQSVGELVFAVGANTTWTIDCMLFIHNATSNVGGVKVAVSLPTSATMKLIAVGTAGSATAQTVSALSTSGTLSGVSFMTFASTTTGAAFVRITGSIAIAGTAGNVQIQAAETTAADVNTVELKSFLNALRV